MNPLQNRIKAISKKLNLSHLGSNLTAVGIIDRVYHKRKPHEPFVLSCGHAGLALYVVLEKYLGVNAEELYKKHGTHPNRDIENGIYCSTGSLGWGITIAAGMAFADRDKNVWCLISDGEAFEGSIWEVANVMHRYKLDNLKVCLNWNGWSAYHSVSRNFVERVKAIFPSISVCETSVKDYGFKGLEAHYVKL